MRKLVLILTAIITGVHGSPAQIKVLDLKGDVRVRHGVHEAWQPVSIGDILKPEDSMKSGKRASAIISVDGSKRVTLPGNVIVDLSDFRILTREDLLLNLAMERIRAVPAREQKLLLPQTTVIHGAEKGPSEEMVHTGDQGILQLNGTRVLYKNGYYATSALRAKEVFRLYPELAKILDVRLMVASALEKENLLGEALSEYVALTSEDLSRSDRALVQGKITQLKKRAG